MLLVSGAAVTGSGYFVGHVLLQQFMCLPCHPLASCLIDEATVNTETDGMGRPFDGTLMIPLVYAQRLAAKVSDFSRTGLKIKVGQWYENGGPLRQDRSIMWVPPPPRPS